MKWIILFSIAASFCAGFVIGYYIFTADPEVRIVETVVYKTQYFANPQTLADYKECYDSPIAITAEAHGETINIYVTDSCKSAEAEIGIACPSKVKLSTGAIIFGAGTMVGALLVFILF